MDCPTPAKRRYRSQAEANRTERDQRMRLGVNRGRLQAYECPTGEHWHLTSQTPEQHAAIYARIERINNPGQEIVTVSNAPAVFAYGDTLIRTAEVDGKRWATAADICAALDIANVTQAVGRLDLNDRLILSRSKGICATDTFWDGIDRRVNSIIMVSEDGATDLVLDSRKPEAKAFRRWLTHEVWPAIRDTGTYNAAPVLLTYTESLRALADSIEARELAEAKIALDAPKVSYVDTFVTDADLLSFSTVASTCGVLESQLRSLLIERDWIYVQTDSRWSEKKSKKMVRNRYSEKSDKKSYFQRVENHEAPRFHGSEVMHTLKITPAGAEAIARLVVKVDAKQAAN